MEVRRVLVVWVGDGMGVGCNELDLINVLPTLVPPKCNMVLLQ